MIRITTTGRQSWTVPTTGSITILNWMTARKPSCFTVTFLPTIWWTTVPSILSCPSITGRTLPGCPTGCTTRWFTTSFRTALPRPAIFFPGSRPKWATRGKPSKENWGAPFGASRKMWTTSKIWVSTAYISIPFSRRENTTNTICWITSMWTLALAATRPSGNWWTPFTQTVSGFSLTVYSTTAAGISLPLTMW